MYFVPIRKLKMLIARGVSTKKERKYLPLHEDLEKVSDLRSRYSRKWLLLIIMILVFLYIMLLYKSAQYKFFIRQTVPINSANKISNRKKGRMVKHQSNLIIKNIANEAINDFDVKILKNELKVKDINVTALERANKSMLLYQTHKVRNTPDDARIELPYTRNGTQELATVTHIELPLCGPIVKKIYNKQYKTNTSIHNLLSDVRVGGYYYPRKCRSRHKVAVLVPYRNRERNLGIFMHELHPFLMKQQLEYRIFVIEQTGEKLFNRGKLFNIGFMEMMKYNEWHCVVLHDVDLLPQSDKILYTCPTYPRHMVGTVIEKANLTYAQYHTFFGGVSALSVQHYRIINGFSNLYWGWGGEDNDMYWRILSARLPMVRYNKTIALYKSLPHAEQPRNNHRYDLLKFAVARYKSDGLSSLVYKVVWTKCRHLYTHILADVNPLKENITEMYSKLFVD